MQRAAQVDAPAPLAIRERSADFHPRALTGRIRHDRRRQDRVHPPHLFRHPAFGRVDPGQLPWSAEAVRRKAERRHRDDLLPGRPARDHRLAGSRQAAPADARGGGGVHRGGHRPPAVDPVQPEPGLGPRGTGLDLQLRGAAGLDEPHDAVQGQGRQEHRTGQPRALCLSVADGGGHPALPRDDGAGGRGPETACGTDPRHRGKVQPRLRCRFLPADRAGHRRRGDAGDELARRDEEDVEVGPFGRQPHQPDRRRRRHRAEDQAGQDRPGTAARQP